MHVHGAGEVKSTAQRDITCGLDGDFVVEGGRCGQAALEHALDIHVLTTQGHQGAGLQPSTALGQGQAAVSGLDIKSAQACVTPTNHAVDHHVVQAGEHNAPARVAGQQLAGAAGLQADLADAHAGVGAGVDDDVALSLQTALDVQGLLGVDDDVGVAAQGHQLALQHRMAGRAQDHAAAEGLQPAAGAEQHVLRARGAGQGVEFDRGVGTHIARHGDRTGLQRGVANQHLGAALAGVDGGQSHRRGGAWGGTAVGNLSQAQALSAAAIDARQRKGVPTRDQLQAAFKQAHADVVCGHAQRAVDGVLHIGHQGQQVAVAGGVDHRHGDGAALDDGTQVQAQVELDVAAELARGELGKAIGQDFLLPGGQHDGHIARGAELDFAVFAEGAQAGVAAEHHAVVQPRLFQGGGGAGAATAHVDQLARGETFAQVDLALGQDGDDGVTVLVARRAAQQSAQTIAVVGDGTTGHHQAVDFRVAQCIDLDATVFLRGDQAARARQFDAGAVQADAAFNADQLTGAEGAAQLGQAAVAGRGHATQVDLGVGAQDQGGILIDPLHHLHRTAVHLLGHHGPAAGDLAHHADAAHGVDQHRGASRTRGAAQRVQTTGGAHNDTKAVVIGARRREGLHQHMAGGGDGGVHQHLLAGTQGDGRVVLCEGQAAGGVVTPGGHGAMDFHVARSLQQHIGAGCAATHGVHARGGMHIQAGALQRSGAGVAATQVGTVHSHATQQGDAAGHGGFRFPVGEGIGLHQQRGIGPHQVDGAAQDGGVLHLDVQVGVGFQGGQRAGEQEAIAALAGQHMRVAHLQRVHLAVVVGIERVQAEAALGVGAVGHDPAVGRQFAAGAPDHVGVAVVTALAFHKLLAQAVVAGTDFVEDRAGVSVEAAGGQHLGLLGFGEVGVGGAFGRHLDVAPAHVGVGVIGVVAIALGEAQAVATGFGVEEHRAAPAAVAGSGQDHVLLCCGQFGKRQAVDRLGHAAPDQAGLGRVHGVQSGQLGHDSQCRLGTGVDQDGAADPGKAQLGQHHVLLRGAQSFKGGVLGRCGHAAPVDGREVVVGRAETTHHPQLRRCVGVDPMGAQMQRETQCGGDHLLLLRGQLGKVGVGRRRRDRAPVDLVVAVIGQRAMGEALHLLEARCGVVVEEVFDRWNLHQHELVGVGLAGGQGARGDGADVVDEMGDEGALRLGQVRPAGVHIGAGHIVGGDFGAVFPQVARHGVVVKHIAQVLGHHQLLSAAQGGECGVGSRCGHARARPVDQGIAVVGRGALQQGAAHVQAAIGQGTGEHQAVVLGVARTAGHGVASHQGGGEGAGLRVVERGGRAGGHARAIHRRCVDGITQCGRHQVFLRVAERAEAHFVDRAHHQVGQGGFAQAQGGTQDERLQRRRRCAVTRSGAAQAAGGQIGQRQLNGRRVGQLRGAASGHGFNGRTEQEVEIVGAVVGAGLAGLDDQVASGGDRARQAQLFLRAKGQAGTGAAQHGGIALEGGTRDDRAAAEQVHVTVSAQVHHRVGQSGLHRGAAAQGQAGTGVDLDPGRLAHDLDAGGTDHRTAGANVQHTAVVQHLHAAAGGAKEASRLGAHLHIGAVAGAGAHVEVDTLLRNQPAAQVHLLGDVEVQTLRAQTRVGHPQRCLEVQRPDLQQAAVGADGTGHLHIAGDDDFVGAQAQGVGQFGLEVKNANGGVFHIAHDHEGLAAVVANLDFLEAIGQRVEVGHGQGHETGGTCHRLVAPEQRLSSAADAVGLAIGLG